MAAITLKCPNCGGELTFEPGSQKYRCEYCDSEFDQQEADRLLAGQTDANDSRSDQAGKDAETPFMVEYECPSCGARIVTDETTAATFCYYCHNPVLLQGRLSGEFLPDKVIPFQFDREAAEKQFLSFVRHKRFVPKAFFEESQLEKLSGVYYPYWMCDCEVAGRLSGEATRVRVWVSGETEFTETSIYHVEREGEIEVSQITRNALKKSDKKLVEGVMPFRMQEAKPFSMGYLSGFQAEKRDLERQDFEEEVRRDAGNYSERTLRNTIEGYSTVNARAERMEVRKEDWQYLLLPVWVLTYQGRNGHMYYYAMNGQTGNICGELPVDYAKLGLFSALAALAVLILCLIGGYLI